MTIDLDDLEAKARLAESLELPMVACPTSVVLVLVARVRELEATAAAPLAIKSLEWRDAGKNKYGGESWEACGCNKWYKILDVGKDNGNGLQFYLEYFGQYETLEEAKFVAQQKHEQSLHPCLYSAPLSHVTLQARVRDLEEALTPSIHTKGSYSGEFTIAVERIVDEDDEVVDGGASDPYEHIMVPWTTIKEIMAAIRKRARFVLGGSNG